MDHLPPPPPSSAAAAAADASALGAAMDHHPGRISQTHCGGVATDLLPRGGAASHPSSSSNVADVVPPVETINQPPQHDGRRQQPARPCRFYRRGYCRYGDLCRFQHAGAGATAGAAAAAAAATARNSNDDEAPEEAPLCRNWIRGKCRRGSRCRYTHPSTDPFPGRIGGFQYMASQLLSSLLDGESEDEDTFGDEMEQRMRNGGFTDDDVYELSLQGIKPWDDEAWDALAVLNGMSV